jgi:hypothetical protein
LDILHLDDSHPAATIVADLTKPNDVPSNAFDCIVCTQVLHLIFEVDRAVSELWRILKPGGVLLATVPHISMCDPGWHEVWRFTPEGLGALVGKSFGTDGIDVRAYGNSLTAAGELRGLVAEEFSKATLAYSDPGSRSSPYPGAKGLRSAYRLFAVKTVIGPWFDWSDRDSGAGRAPDRCRCPSRDGTATRAIRHPFCVSCRNEVIELHFPSSEAPNRTQRILQSSRPRRVRCSAPGHCAARPPDTARRSAGW